jgi:hypothetical protein
MGSTTLLPRYSAAAPRPGRSLREACLRPGYSSLYPGLIGGEWKTAAVLADQVLAAHLLRGTAAAVRGRVLPESHFAFRGGISTGGEREGLRERTRAS